jgi:hypothetical protein
MPILARHLRLYAAFTVAILVGFTHGASAQVVDNVVTRPLATAPESLKAPIEPLQPNVSKPKK